MIAVHAGTCMSTRLRGEPNSYNQLHLDGEHARIVRRVWDGRLFVDAEEKRYRRSERDRERIVKDSARELAAWLGRRVDTIAAWIS